MVNQQISEIQGKVTPILREAGVRRAGVFGSVARGDFHEKSDVDMLVDIKKNISLFDFVGLKLGLEDVLGRKVDLVEYDSIKPVIRESILAEEIRIL